MRLVHQGRVGGGTMVAELPLDENGNKIVRIGHSPDPDDAFMFHAMTTGAFPTPGYNFVHELQDIETLNHRAMNCELEVSAVSIHAFPEISNDYALMNCGASMGEGYGPMVVSLADVSTEEVRSSTIAVPGLKTSAFLGLRLAWGDCDIAVVPFDEIIPRVLEYGLSAKPYFDYRGLDFADEDGELAIQKLIEQVTNLTNNR